jgi:hypothetical protein
MNAFFRKLGWLTRKSSKEAELREELQFHMEEEAERRQSAGLTQGEARWAAHRELGNLALVKEIPTASFFGIRRKRLVDIHGLLFYGLDHKQRYYPTRRDEEAINPNGSRSR